MTRRVVTAAALAALLAGSAGCGGQKFVPVSGRVTLDGQPLANAVVSFLPAAQDGSVTAAGPGSMAVTDDRGEFALKVVPGRTTGGLRVAVTPNNPDGPYRGTPIPARYNTATTLRFTVPPGGTAEANFDLTS